MEFGEFLPDRESISWKVSEDFPQELAPLEVYQQAVSNGLEVAVATCARRPTADVLRRAWRNRRDGRASPVLLVVAYADHQIALVGPTGDRPAVHHSVEQVQAQQLAGLALDEPTHHAALRVLLTNLPELASLTPGLRNAGLLATWELQTGVRQRSDWQTAVSQGSQLLELRGRSLVARLGFEVEDLASTTWMLTADGKQLAVAVFCHDDESFEASATRFGDISPVARALAVADNHRVDWIVLTRASEIRLYAARSDTGVGRKGRAETFVEINLSMLPSELAGYLPLLISPEALVSEGSVDEILADSERYAAELARRLRQRIYYETVPLLAAAIAGKLNQEDRTVQLATAYEQVMLVLFRLLFVAYAEDRDLLPYRTNDRYRGHSLQRIVSLLVKDCNAGTHDYDKIATSMWADVTQLWSVVDTGNVRWGVPAYNGGLFSSDPEVSAAGAGLADLELTDSEFAPALAALMVDQTPEGYGPIDFRSLSVREFGTIYEGLLESKLALAPHDLTLRGAGGTRHYVPASAGDEIVVRAGDVYLYHRSGERKSRGSYFTKPFAVDYLLDSALEPALDRHIARLDRLYEDCAMSALEEEFFDFRCADISMGSGHFLVAAIDRIETRLSGWLSEHPVDGVWRELERLRGAAEGALDELAEGVEIQASALLRRQIARRCIYGVDSSPLAVELARLAIWIHTFIPGLPLSLLDHNLVCGDSLTGVTLMADVVKDFEPGANPDTPSIFRSGIEAELAGASEALRVLSGMAEADRAEIADARRGLRNAQEDVAVARMMCDLMTAHRAGACTLPLTPDRSTVIRAHRDPSVTEALARFNPLHFPVAFPQVFVRDRPGFDCILGNPPWDEVTVEELGFWMTYFPGLKALPKNQQQKKMAQYRKDRPDLVDEYTSLCNSSARLRRFLLSGLFPGMETGDPELYKAFSWRFWDLVRPDGWIGVVLPRSVFTASGSGPWRSRALSCSQTSIVFVRNDKEWAFSDVNPGYGIALVTLHRTTGSVQTEVRVRGPYMSQSQFASRGKSLPARIAVADLRRIEEQLGVPLLGSEDELALYFKLHSHPRFGDATRDDFIVRPMREFDATNDSDEFLSGGDWPVYNHRNVGVLRFDREPGEFAHTDFSSAISELERRRQNGRRARRSAYYGMPEEWFSDFSCLPALNPRIVYRRLVHAGNWRKIWFALAPARTIVTGGSPHLLFLRGDIRSQAYVLGVMSTLAVDWIGHARMNLDLTVAILQGIPVPRYDPNCDVASRLVELTSEIAVGGEGDYGEWAELGCRSAVAGGGGSRRCAE